MVKFKIQKFKAVLNSHYDYKIKSSTFLDQPVYTTFEII